MGSTPPLASADDFVPSKRNRIWLNAQQPAIQNHDRISALPDDILIKILSLLSLRDAAVTHSLSTRWRHLWQNVDDLSLNTCTFGMQVSSNSIYDENPDFWNSEATKFVNKVNWVLRHHNGIGITNFKVQFPLNSTHASDLDRWVAFAIASCAKALKLWLVADNALAPIQHAELYNFPLHYFADVRSCKLNLLHLAECSLEAAPANLSGFSYLRHLKLFSVSVVDSVVLNIVSSCHALDHLVLLRCRQLINVRISNSQLAVLEVIFCKSLISCGIHAEKLRCFFYKGHKIDIGYECAPNLSKLHVLFSKNHECPMDLMGHLPKLRTLALQFPSCLQVSRVLQKRERFATLKEIVLCLLTSWERRICSVAYLLKAAPLVQTLNVEVRGDQQSPKELNFGWPKNCNFRRLRTVRIGGFSGESELLGLLFFLLARSRALKTLVVDTHRSYCRGFYRWKREESEDSGRCSYARGVAFEQLAPKVPSTVKLNVM
ncbi:hypothetical protein EJB05_14637 [Eragrostis curvula]|uniref:F-box domain-containing protein n=1 Tax=Eragrostis curvula TaxID=38414 RepID=A0A5J9VZR1_9POAL|nr:hypothetical protein EJB05_14637 [Eragrostis curvula]